MITVTSGVSNQVVTSGAAVDLLGSTTGVTFGTTDPVDWSLVVSTRDSDVTVVVYLATGTNAGLVVVTGYGQTVTTAAPLQLQVPRELSSRIRVTAQATGADAHVDCDFRASRSSS